MIARATLAQAGTGGIRDDTSGGRQRWWRRRMRTVGEVRQGNGDDVVNSIHAALVEDALWMDVDGLHLTGSMNDSMGSAATTAFR